MLNKNVLVVAVHPDDETLGCGGTLLKHYQQGNNLHWLICTESNREKNFIEERNHKLKRVAEFYNFKSVHQLKFKATKLDEYSSSEIIEKISKIFLDIKPEIVYLPFLHDVHSDHRIIFQAAYACTKSFRYPFVKEICMMETLSETEFSPAVQEKIFIPNKFVDITKFFAKKLEIIKIYDDEIGVFPFPRSLENIESLAKYRGATSNCKYAESFQILKLIS